MITYSEILSDIQATEAAAKLVLEQCYNIRKKLERVDAPASPKGMTTQQREKLYRSIAKRKARILANSKSY